MKEERPKKKLKFSLQTNINYIESAQNHHDIGNNKSLSPLQFNAAWISKKGNRNENQDYYLVTENRMQRKLPIWCVFDGHGPFGTNCSRDASKFVETYSKQFLTENLSEKEIKKKIKLILKQTNDELLKIAETVPKDKKDYGTTCVFAALSKDNILVLANIGDSRAILIRDGKFF